MDGFLEASLRIFVKKRKGFFVILHRSGEGVGESEAQWHMYSE